MDDRLKNLADAVGCLVERGPDLIGIRDRERARVRDEARRLRRELWDRVQALHEVLLDRRLEGTYEESVARAELPRVRQALDELSDLLLGEWKSLLVPPPPAPTLPAEPPPPPIPTLVVVPPAARPPAPILPVVPSAASANDRRPGWISVERSHQDLLTLQENAERLPPGELHGRCDLLLARARWLQDSAEGPHLNESQRKHLRTLFGSVQGLQKELNLPYLSTLNRDYTTDWSAYVARLESRYGSLDQRIQDLRVAEQKVEARRRAAIAQAARRRLEGAEILSQLRLFLPTFAPAEAESLASFLRLVADAVGALGGRDPDLRRVVAPYRAYLEGPTFRALRDALAADAASPVVPEAPVEAVNLELPTIEPSPSPEADHEEALQGAFPVQRGLILGGTVRPEARDMLRDHLGLISLEWWDAATIHRYGRWFSAQLIAENPSLAIILTDRLSEKDLATVESTLDPERVIRVSGGQSLPSILAALPVPNPDLPRQRIESVDEAVRRALEEHPEAIVACFNSSSEEKGYPFQDPPAIYRALVFLATTYRDARAGRVPCPSLAERCFAACGMNYQPHQSATTMGRYSASYEATYKGQRYALTEHLGRGTNRDPRYSVRIAFRYHREDDVILLGFLGQHQRTTIS